MSEQESTRRKFLTILGLTAGATLVSSSILASVIDNREILKLTSEQQEFMIRYGKWMDEFIEVIRVQKRDPDDSENNKRMIVLTETAHTWQPQLTRFMNDKTFSLIYNVSIEKMRKEI